MKTQEHTADLDISFRSAGIQFVYAHAEIKNQGFFSIYIGVRFMFSVLLKQGFFTPPLILA